MQETKIKSDLQSDIIQAIRDNDETIIKKLYLDNYPKVESFILKNRGTKEHAKDIYQDAFVKTWQNIKLNRFIPKNASGIQGYLYKIAHNKWIDVLRSDSFKKDKNLDLVLKFKGAVENQEITDENQNYETIAHLERVFDEMGEPCRQLLIDFYFNKRSMRDISTELDIEESTARNKKYRCMEKLRQKFQDIKYKN